MNQCLRCQRPLEQPEAPKPDQVGGFVLVGDEPASVHGLLTHDWTEGGQSKYYEKDKYIQRLRDLLHTDYFQFGNVSLCGTCLHRPLSDEIRHQNTFEELCNDQYKKGLKILSAELENLFLQEYEEQEVELDKQLYEVHEEISKLLEEHRKLKEEEKLVDAEKVELSLEREKFWEEFSRERHLRDTLEQEGIFIKEETERIRQSLIALDVPSRVYDDVFFFSFPENEPIGSINGLRLGLLSFSDPDWSEVNAALGHLTLFIATIQGWLREHEKELGTGWKGSALSTYRIHCRGSYSFLENRLDSKEGQLPLHNHTSTAITGWLPSWVSSEPVFSKAVCTLVSCLGEIWKWITTKYPKFFENSSGESFSIEGDKVKKESIVLGKKTVIHCVSVKFHSSSYGNWSLAMKLILNISAQVMAWFQHQQEILKQ
eukprot:TRINITY_DN2059_c2_g1_i1.p1 TRINITY_DN2059_c2_g1~~TRINITY_DN2059_c2_g1_i1.p1  ORF type:complete len:429 (+),score=76.30 TRINITY_DN2059_c2_g1_i1:3-1289(+)